MGLRMGKIATKKMIRVHITLITTCQAPVRDTDCLITSRMDGRLTEGGKAILDVVLVSPTQI